MVGAIIGWFFLALLAILLIILLVPLRVKLYYSAKNGFNLYAGVLFLRIKIYENGERVFKAKKHDKKAKTRRRKTKRIKKETQAKDGEEKPKQEKDFSQKIDFLRKIIKSFGAALGILIRNLRIKKVDLILPVAANDAAAVSEKCSRFEGLIAGAVATLNNSPLHIKYKRLYVLPDYAGLFKEKLYFSCIISISPVIIIAAGFKAFAMFLKKD